MKKQILGVILLSALPALVHAAPDGWTQTEKTMVVRNCQEGIFRDAENHYLRQNNLRREELPLHFREHASEALTPLFAVCDCIVESISIDWSFEYFTSHPDEYPVKAKSLIDNQTCKIPEK